MFPLFEIIIFFILTFTKEELVSSWEVILISCRILHCIANYFLALNTNTSLNVKHLYFRLELILHKKHHIYFFVPFRPPTWLHHWHGTSNNVIWGNECNLPLQLFRFHTVAKMLKLYSLFSSVFLNLKFEYCWIFNKTILSDLQKFRLDIGWR